MNLKLTLFLLLGLLIVFSPIVAQDNSTTKNEAEAITDTAAMPQAALKYQSLLWQIEGNDLTTPSFLYGTMHSHDERAHRFGDSVMVKFDQCEAVALELLTDSLDVLGLMGFLMMPDTTLDQLLSPEDYKMVKTFIVKELGFVAIMLNVDKIKPIFVSTLISEMGGQAEMDVTVDDYFQKMGKKQGKVLIGIETMDEQMAALNAIPLKDQAEMLVEYIKTADDAAPDMEILIDYYETQNLDGMLDIYASEKETMGTTFENEVVLKRNYIMAHRMDSLVQIRPTFNAVGALHLPGDEGVIELLRKKGYAVTPVYSTYTKAIESKEEKEGTDIPNEAKDQ